jgi:hypothetical protein
VFGVVKKKTGKEATMKRTRSKRSSRRKVYRDDLMDAMGKFLPQQGLPLQTDKKNRRWTARLLVVGAILMSWDVADHLKDAFEHAWDCLAAMYPTRRRPGRTYRGFIETLRRHSASLLETVSTALRGKMQQVAGGHWRMGRWVPMAADGSRVECPRTKANEKALGCAGRKKTGPQLFVTTVYHAPTGLPWCWRSGGGKSSERAHLQGMIPLLPDGTLLLADAGFTGFELLRSLQEADVEFIVRVGANVRLLRKLGYYVQEGEGIVSLWPQDKRDQPPVILRHVVLGSGCRHPVHVVTSVLDESELRDAEVGRMYRLRWGVEVMYRSLKQTMSCRKLRSHTPDAAEVELNWAMVGLWMLGLATVEAMDFRTHAPSSWSVAEALRAVRTAAEKPRAARRRGGLRPALRKAVKDAYKRRGSKKARDWPHKKTETPAGAPKIRTATETEVKHAKQLRTRQMAA